MKANKPAPNHVIFKKISRDKSVSGADVRGLSDDFFFLRSFLNRWDQYQNPVRSMEAM